jgi:uncharacterized membrane protein (Fun14 family)
LSEIITPIVYQLGTGSIMGFFVGYAIKKLMKTLAVITGLFAFILIYLGYIGVVNVNYEKLVEFLKGSINVTNQISSWITPIIANLPFAGSFVVGLAIGSKIG